MGWGRIARAVVVPCCIVSVVVEFVRQCAHVLNETESFNRLINCESLMDDYTFPNADCFKLDHSQPTVAPPQLGGCGSQALPLPPDCVRYCSSVFTLSTLQPSQLVRRQRSTFARKLALTELICPTSSIRLIRYVYDWV